MFVNAGGLGFVGLSFFNIVTGGLLGKLVRGISEEFLGGKELLIKTFEFLHTFFFKVRIAFFLINGMII